MLFHAFDCDNSGVLNEECFAKAFGTVWTSVFQVSSLQHEFMFSPLFSKKKNYFATLQRNGALDNFLFLSFLLFYFQQSSAPESYVKELFERTKRPGLDLVCIDDWIKVCRDDMIISQVLPSDAYLFEYLQPKRQRPFHPFTPFFLFFTSSPH